MAEIGLAASIISVAAFGASVATTLYETADVMRNANQQITALAKHVTQFTAVLNHMGQVLKTEKTNCSKEVLRDIRKIRHSCKRTFREINSTVKAKHFRRFSWLLKRTKAMELEARLDSQQSMLQCMIHTLTVSKLSHIDSRSKEDSEHITGLKVEITLLKTLIKESYNNLMTLRRAEQTEAETKYRHMSGDGSHTVVLDPYGNVSTPPSDFTGVSNAFETPVTVSPSPTSNASRSDNEDSNSDGEAGNGDIDREDPGPKGDDLNTDGLKSGPSSNPRLSYDDFGGPSIHRESNLLLQMVPYRPPGPERLASDRLISDGQGPDSGTKSATEEATNSVRLLLDKWTTSGSAPVSNILDEEAAREKEEAELDHKRRASDPQFDRYRWSSPPGAGYTEADYRPTLDPRGYEYSRRFQDDYMPPPPPLVDPQPRYPTAPYMEREFWRPSNHFSQPPSTKLGGEVLTALRSTRGGIYYIKSNHFKQVHYVDHFPIYTCAFVPSHMIPFNEDTPLSTELGRGLVRKEALDLLAYSYTETPTGNFSISANIELGEIEELVRLSFQALDRNLKECSKKVIKERGWSEAIDAANGNMPGTRSNEPLAAARYPPPRPEYSNQNLYDEKYRHRPYSEYEDVSPDKSVSFQAPIPHLRPREQLSARRRVRPIEIPSPAKVKRQEQDAMKTTRPEVRFTLPRTQLVSSTAETAKEAQKNPPKPDLFRSKTDDELQKARQRLEQVKKRKEEAEKAKDLATAADLTYYAIPDLEADLEKLLKQQREEQEKPAAQVSRNEEGKIFRHTEVETESENSDDEGGSEAGDLYE